MLRVPARIAAVILSSAALLAAAAGTASAGGYGDSDQRCEKPRGVIVVCTADEVVDLEDVEILTGLLHGHH